MWDVDDKGPVFGKNPFDGLNKAFDGLNKTFDEMDKVFDLSRDALTTILSIQGPLPTFPPCNIFGFRQATVGEKTGALDALNEYVVELALSGYTEDDVEVTVQQINGFNVLTIQSNGINSRIGPDIKWFHRGIAGRAFTMQFTIAHNVKIKSATLENGLLSIFLTIENPLVTKTIEKISLKKCPDCGYAPGERNPDEGQPKATRKSSHPTPACGTSDSVGRGVRDNRTPITREDLDIRDDRTPGYAGDPP